VKINEKFLQIENQSKKLIAVTQDKMTVEKLRDKKYEDYKAELSRSEEKFIDDFLSNRSSLII
jgi:flagellar biosynthesis chaperone FliJ